MRAIESRRHASLAVFAVMGVLCHGSGVPCRAADGQPGVAAVLDKLHFREIGPAVMGGRIDDIAVVESDPRVVYIGTASGGLWKTENSGISWQPLFDKQPVSSIGDVTVAPSDPSIVWVGTGEANNRQSSSWGDGVYKSVDGGRTWRNMGVRDSHHIARIAIHPADPNIVYVAAAGRLWGPNKERGVFKTADGGRTWKHVLSVNEDTGAIDLAMHPARPEILYAAAYQRRRTPFGFNGGGPHSGLYRTTNGGATWVRITKGLPAGDTGRIGVGVSRSKSDVVYAMVENERGGVFRSGDSGESWTKVSDTNERPMYFSKIAVDPNNDQKVWLLGRPLYYSEDGGRTYRNRGLRIHPDHHALWINPANSDHMIAGSDGGVHWSYDAGLTWDYVNTLALGQFYEIGFDMQKPYQICGGLQDNGNWCGPSATLYHQGITNEDWYRVGGNDGMYMQIDPTDHNTIYVGWEEGNLARRDHRTGEMRPIRPRPGPGEQPYRFQWNPPLLLSPHDPGTIYFGAQFLLRSTDRGEHWAVISPDLTTGADRAKLPIMGQMPGRNTLSLHDGVAAYPCLTTISESPLRRGLLWAGTDDGNLQLSRDGGMTWTNVAARLPGAPRGTYVTRVIASRHAEGTAYVTLDGHRANDFGIYVYTTADYGRTWRSIANGIPRNGGVINVIREHFRNSNLLLVGTEFGAHITFDRGENWHKLTANLPTVPVDDIAIHPRDNDLILATHGRSIWVLDDMVPLEQLTEAALSSGLFLFDIRPATAWRMTLHKRWIGDRIFAAKNPPYGAIISYYLKSQPAEKLKIAVEDQSGKMIREIEGGSTPGLHRVNWDLRYPPAAEPTREQLARMAGSPQFVSGFSFPPRGPMVEPGQYVVRITAGNRTATKTVIVEEDPRVRVAPADRRARHEALMESYAIQTGALRLERAISGLRDSIAKLMRAVESGEPAGKAAEIRTAALKMDATAAERQRGLTAIVQRAERMVAEIDGFTAPPTEQQGRELHNLKGAYAEQSQTARRLGDEDLAQFNRILRGAGLAQVAAPAGFEK